MNFFSASQAEPEKNSWVGKVFRRNGMKRAACTTTTLELSQQAAEVFKKFSTQDKNKNSLFAFPRCNKFFVEFLQKKGTSCVLSLITTIPAVSVAINLEIYFLRYRNRRSKEHHH